MRTITVTILCFITILVLAGIGLVLWRASSKGSSDQSQNQNVPPTFPETSTYTTASSSTQTQPQVQTNTQAAPVDVSAEYGALFQNLNATKLVFTNVDSDAVDSGIYKLYAQDVSIAKQYASSSDLSVEVAMTDLNYDGVPEAIVYEDLPGFCGTQGCSLDIYQQKQGAWAKLFSTFVLSDSIATSNTVTNQFADLFLSTWGTIGSETSVVNYEWDGSTYQPKQTVATWNGSVFQATPLPQ